MERPLEMVKTKLIAFIALAMALTGCCCGGHSYSWEKFVMDGHRTGVTAPNAVNIPEALGTVDSLGYHAPNGQLFTEGTTPEVARVLIASQEHMAALKQVVGFSTKEMTAERPESDLSDWTVDLIRTETQRLTGKKIDVAITNFGGIRVDMPAGDVIMDDIRSMFPFKNYLCYVEIKGTDLEEIFKNFARRGPECVSGVKFVAEDGKIKELLVDGQPVDPEKIYRVATVDFLLDGGDSVYVAKNAQKLVQTQTTLIGIVEPYVLGLQKAGKPIEYQTDGRVEIIKHEEEE